MYCLELGVSRRLLVELNCSLITQGMEMKILKCMLALAASLFAATPSHAAFLSSTHADFGLNTVTYDTETQLGWLDFTTTRGRSYNQVKIWLETDAKYAGLTAVF